MKSEKMERNIILLVVFRNLTTIEVITRYTLTGLASKGMNIVYDFGNWYFTTAGMFKTDANGRQLMARRCASFSYWSQYLKRQDLRRNSASSYTYENTEPISGNYYPINSRIMVQDDEKQLTILTDR
jgi:hypothetical protein